MSLPQGSLIEDVVLLMPRNVLLKSQAGVRVEDSALLSVINQQRRLIESNTVFVDESQKTHIFPNVSPWLKQSQRPM